MPIDTGFVALHEATLTSDTVAELTDAEHRLFMMSLAKGKKTRGVLHVKKPGLVARWAGFVDRTEVCAEAIAGLLEKGFWVRNEDGSVSINGWATWQQPLDDLARDADLWRDSVTGGHQSAAHVKAGGISELAKALLDDLTETLTSTDTPPLAAYQAVWHQINEDAATYRRLYPDSADPVVTLRFKLLDHAMNHYRPGQWRSADYGSMRAAAKKLGANGAALLIRALDATATQELDSPARYVMATARRVAADAH